MARTTVKTVDEAIEVLGGTAQFRRLTKASSQQVWNWKQRGLPTRLSKLVSEALARAGYEPDGSLWAVEMPSMTDLPMGAE